MAEQPGTVAAQHRLDAALDAAAMEQTAVNAAAGRRTVALARVLAAVEAGPEAMLDLTVERVASATPERRSSVAHRALVAEVACALGVSEHVAQGWLADAQVLATKATGTLDMLCEGGISYQHAQKLADAVADLPPSAARQVERVVLGRAPGMTAARFGSLTRKVRDRLHPVPAEVRHEAAALKADVWVDDGRDGMSWLTAHLPTAVARAVHDRITRTAATAKTGGDPRGVGPLRAATLTALLLDTPAGDQDRATQANGTTTGTTTTGTGTVTMPAGGPYDAADPELSIDRPDPPRPPALPDIPDPLATLARNVRPVVHVTVPVTTLAGTGEAPGTLDGTIPVDAETARHLTARAPTLRRVLTDPVTGAMLTLDRRTYVVPADLRAYLTERDVTCRFPGCRIPARRCDLDHTIAWAHGGATDARNLASLCRRHHTMKHESRWQVEQLDAGVLAWTSPRGRTHLTTPGSADHALAQLDAWAVEAASLATATAVDTQTADRPTTARHTGKPPTVTRGSVAEDGDGPPF